VRAAGRALCARGYLLEEDVELSATMAARLWDYTFATEATAGAASPPTRHR
jgi:hypothetical protein